MSKDDAERAAKLESIAHELASLLCQKLGLLIADQRLDDARRFAFTKNFSGYPDAAVHHACPVDADSLQAAAKLEGLTIAETVRVIELARYAMWAAHFINIPGTTFATQFDAYRRGIANVGAGQTRH